MSRERDAIARYVLDGSDLDLRRLLRISSVTYPSTRAALPATPIGPGWSVLDCGCGPLGAMAILAELVGPSGHVTGMDFHPPTVDRARTVLKELHLDDIEVRVGDVNDPNCETGGPHDLVFTRCFLMHQPDPLHTLQRIAANLRPGGWLVAMEPLWEPPPFAHPPFDALTDAWELLRGGTVGSGAAPTAVTDLPDHARRAGFSVERSFVQCEVLDPETGFALHAATTRAARERIVATQSASADRVDSVVGELDAVQRATGWVTTPLFFTLALQLN